MASPSTSERIKAARSAPRDYRDVDVVLDQAVAEQVAELEEQIATKQSEVADLEDEKERIRPDLRMSDPRLAKIDKQIEGIEEQIGKLEETRDDLRRGTLVRLRFDKIDGEQWAAIAARHPQRVDSAIDRLSGYNYHATAREAAPICGYALGDGDAKEPLSPEDWKGLYEVISGREIENIAMSLWEMNDFAPRRRIDAARKVSADGTGSKSS